MKKTKLEVIRINEDVIVTSGVAKINYGKEHINIWTLTGNAGPGHSNDGIGFDVYNANTLTWAYGNTFAPDEFAAARPSGLGFTPTETGWYYFDGNTFQKCNDADHSEYQ